MISPLTLERDLAQIFAYQKIASFIEKHFALEGDIPKDTPLWAQLKKIKVLLIFTHPNNREHCRKYNELATFFFPSIPHQLLLPSLSYGEFLSPSLAASAEYWCMSPELSSLGKEVGSLVLEKIRLGKALLEWDNDSTPRSPIVGFEFFLEKAAEFSRQQELENAELEEVIEEARSLLDSAPDLEARKKAISSIRRTIFGNFFQKTNAKIVAITVRQLEAIRKMEAILLDHIHFGHLLEQTSIICSNSISGVGNPLLVQTFSRDPTSFLALNPIAPLDIEDRPPEVPLEPSLEELFMQYADNPTLFGGTRNKDYFHLVLCDIAHRRIFGRSVLDPYPTHVTEQNP